MHQQKDALSVAQIERFIVEGFIRIDDAFPRELADACRQVLWRATGCTEDDPSTWTRPVVRIGEILSSRSRSAAVPVRKTRIQGASKESATAVGPKPVALTVRIPSALDRRDETIESDRIVERRRGLRPVAEILG